MNDESHRAFTKEEMEIEYFLSEIHLELRNLNTTPEIRSVQ